MFGLRAGRNGEVDGFYVLGGDVVNLDPANPVEFETQLALTVSGGGTVDGTFNLADLLSVEAAGTVQTNGDGLQVRLHAGGFPQRYDTVDESAGLLFPDVDGDVELSLGLTLQPLDLEWSGTWDLAFSDNVFSNTANVAFPSQDDFLDAALHVLSRGLNESLGQPILDQLNGIEIPLTDDLGLLTTSLPGLPQAADDEPGWFEQALDWISGLVGIDADRDGDGLHVSPGTGLAYTVGDALLGGPQLRELIRQSGDLKGGEGVRIGVISDGAIGFEQAQCSVAIDVAACLPEITPGTINHQPSLPRRPAGRQ